MRILYFFEDRAQEGFIKALVERIAQEVSIPLSSLVHDVRSAQHGSRVITEFKRFAKDTMGANPSDVDLLIVAIDGNCRGYRERVEELKKLLDRHPKSKRLIKPGHPFRDKVIYAVPDPHIERWYLMDQRAFKLGVGIDKSPELPSYKCKRDHYKQLLAKTLKESNTGSLLTGAEYAERIVENIESLDSLAKQNAGFERFIEDLRMFFLAERRRTVRN